MQEDFLSKMFETTYLVNPRVSRSVKLSIGELYIPKIIDQFSNFPLKCCFKGDVTI